MHGAELGTGRCFRKEKAEGTAISVIAVILSEKFSNGVKELSQEVTCRMLGFVQSPDTVLLLESKSLHCWFTLLCYPGRVTVNCTKCSIFHCSH